MSLEFVEKVFNIGNVGEDRGIFTFYKKGFNIGTGKVSPSWKDVILSGNTALTLVNAKADGLNYLKLFGGTELLPETYLDTVTLDGACVQRNLPDGYTQVEYIESSGTQYIDTGINSTNGYTINTNILFTSFSYTQVITGSYSRPGGSSTGDSARYFLRVSNGTGSVFYQYNSNTSYGSTNLSLNTKHNIKCKLTKDSQYLEVDGILKTETTISADQAPVSLFLLANVGASGAPDNLCYARIYDCQYYDNNNVIIRNFIPTKRNSDNVLGLYDTVSNTFFTNAGSGTFTAGSDVTTPSPDTPIDIVCNNGVLGIDNQGNITVTGTTETVEDANGNTASAERLLAISTFGKDTQEVISGAVTRNIGIKVLDGTENWEVHNTWYWADILPSLSGDVSARLLCTHFVNQSPVNDLSIHRDTIDSTYLQIAYNAMANATALKSWLADQYANGTPVIVLYCKSATTESVSGQLLTKSPVTQTAGSISNMTINAVSSSHTTPTPTQPLPINCNNGVVKYQTYGLPSGYTKLEYIESTGTQYIDTSKQFQGNIQTYLDTMYVSPLDDWGWGRNGSGQEIIWANTRFYFGGGYSVTTAKELNTRYVYDLDFTDGAMVAKINGSIVRQTTNSYGTQSAGNEIYLFANNNANTPRKFSARVYLFEIRQGSQLLQRLIPARRNSDNVLGMYDTVSDTFLTNAGTGTFTAGADEQPYIYTDGTVETVEIDTTGDTATAEDLLAISTYIDEQNVTTGDITRKVGIKVLDGTEDWIYVADFCYYFKINELVGATQRTSYCSHFPFWSGTDPQSGYYNFGGNPINGNVLFGTTNYYPTLASWKQFLANQYAAGTPVIIVYPLAEATSESVTPQTLTLQEGTNIVEITQASMDNLPLEVSYKAGVTVTITEIENAQLSDQVEVTIT